MPIAIGIIFFLLFFASLCLWILGTIAPAIVSPILRKTVQRKQVFKTFGIATGLLFVLFIIGVLNSDTSSPSNTATASIEPTITPSQDTKIAAVSVQPSPTVEEKIKAMVATNLKGQTTYKQDKLRTVSVTPQALDEKNNPQSWNVRVDFNGDENLTTAMTFEGMSRQMAILYRLLYTSDLPIEHVTLQAFYPLQDQYGNAVTNQYVYVTNLDRAVAEKVNWQADELSLNQEILPGLWHVDFVHAIFQTK